MKAFATFLFGISIGVLVHAQPVLNFVDVGTVPGDAFIYHDCPWQTPGTPGMAQTWDLSTLTTDSLIEIMFVDPATTPDAASFPTATIAADEDSGFAYSAFDNAGGQFLGLSLTGLVTIVYSDPMQMVVYPATYLTSWTDDFAANYSLGGFPIARTGTITAEVDGYGTLIMPYGTLTDVLRVSYVEDYTDAAGFGSSTFHHEYTSFLQAGTHYPIVDIYTITVTPAFGLPTTLQGTHWLVVGPEAVQNASVLSDVFLPYPNPVREQLNVLLAGNGSSGSTSIDLLDATGRIAVHRTLGNIPLDRRREVIDVRGLDAGSYILRVTTDGIATARNIVVE